MSAIVQVEALKAEIYFREHVLGQKPADKNLLRKSVSLEQMTINVEKSLLRMQGPMHCRNSERQIILVGKKIRHRQVEQDGGKKLEWLFTCISCPCERLLKGSQFFYLLLLQLVLCRVVALKNLPVHHP